jgi:hypothetical protein
MCYNKSMNKGFSFSKVLKALGLLLLFTLFHHSYAKIPHYFKELELKCPGPSDPLEMRKEFLTILTQTRSMWPPDVIDVNGNIASGWISIPNIVGTGLWRSVVVHGKEVKVYLRDYREKEENGKKIYLYYDARGVKKLSEKEIYDLLEYIKDYLSSASLFLYENLKDLKVNPPDTTKEELEKEIKIAPGVSVSLKRVLSLPQIYGPESFVPDELYFGPISPWGMVYLGMYGDYTRRIFIHPEAMVYDCLQGKPLILAHEMVHAQPTLQWLPFSIYIDVEILTELNSGLWETHFWELLHPYLAVLNDLIWAAFGYSYMDSGGSADFRSDSAGLIWIDKDRVAKHQKIWEKIAPEIRSWVIEDLMPQIYSDPLYVMAVNMKYCWDSAFLAISFLSRFELAGLGGYQATQGWLSERDKVIEEVWERALDKTGDQVDVKENQDLSKLYPGRAFCPQPFSFSWVEDPRVAALKKQISEDYRSKGKNYVVSKLLRGGYRFSLPIGVGGVK